MIPALLFALIGVVLIVKRRELAHMQALLAGGRISPGCVVAEAVVVIAIGVAIWWFSSSAR